MKHKKLSLNYIIALSIIAFLVVTGTFVVHRGVSGLSDDGTIINVAGRQRMLSQKLSKASLAMQQSTDAANFNSSKKELRETLDLFIKSHSGIQLGNEALEIPEPTLSEQSKNLFKEIEPSFEAVKTSVSNVAKLNFSGDTDVNATVFAQNLPIILQNESIFLKTMNNIVTLFEKDYKAKISTLNIVVYSITAIILAVLFLLAVLFFKPIVAGIQKFIADIENANNKLKESQEEILKSSQITLEANEKMSLAQKELQHTQVILKQNETLFKGVIENTPMVIFSLDKQGEFLLSEGKALDDMGLKVGQVVGMNAFDLYKDNPGMVADLEAVLQGGIPIESVTAFGEEYFENKFTPLKDEFGNVTGMVGISSNVTERQKFQQQLQIAEDETRKSLQEQQVINTELLNAQEKIKSSEDTMRQSLEKALEANEMAFVMQKKLEKSEEEIRKSLQKQQTTNLQLLDAQDKIKSSEDTMRQSLEKALEATEIAFIVQKKLEKSEQETRKSLQEQQSANLQLLDAQGKIESSEDMMRQSLEKSLEATELAFIAQRKLEKSQVEVAQAAVFQKTVLNAATYGIIATDKEGTITLFNEAASQLLGYSVEEIVNKQNPGLFHVGAEIVACAQALSEKYSANIEPGFGVFTYEADKGLPSIKEWTYVRKDGTTFPITLSLTALKDIQGNITGYLGVVEDITEKKAIENERQTRQARLAKQASMLADLSAINFSQITLSQAYEVISFYAATGLEVERVSIWDYKADKIVSKKLYQRTENEYSAGVELFAKDFPNYFDELKTELIIIADDANTDKATAEFSEIYLKPLGIGAMLDVPIRIEGKMTGVLCNEHVGDVRVWESDEVAFAKSIADIISLAFEANKRQFIQKDLEEYSKELKQLFEVVQENETKLADNNKDLASKEIRLKSTLQELRVVQNQMIASAKNDEFLALKRGMTKEDFDKSSNIEQYADLDFSYIDDLKKKNLPVAENEAERLKALYDYDLLDTEGEEDLDGLTRLAAFVCGTPISLISLIDKDRQWFKSDYGLGVAETARDVAFCQYAIMDTKVFEVEDAMQDERFKDNPLVQGSPDIRFYAGAPLTTPDGFNIGTLCVIDKKAAKLSKAQTDALKIIASEVMARLESKRRSKVVLAINNKALNAFGELEKAQEVIQESEKRFTNIAANTPDLIYQFLLTPEGKVSFPYASPAIQDIFEVSPEDVREDGTPIIALTVPEDLARFQQVVAQSAQTMQPFVYEGRFITKSDKEKFVRAQSKPEMQENGNILWNGTMSDITAFKEAQKKLDKAQEVIQESEKRFTNIAANTPDLIYQFLLTPEGKVSFPYTSPAIQDIFELSPQEVKEDAMPIIALMPAEDAARFQQVILESAQTMQSFSYEGRLTTKSGKEKFIRAQSKPELEDGNILWNGTMSDITAFKEAQATVERLSLVASKTDNAVIIANKDGLIDWVNDGFVNLSGHTFEEVKGKKPGSFLQGAGTDQKQVAEFREKLLSKKTFYQELYNYSKNGRGYWVASSVTPILDKNNEIVQFISIASDITATKETQAAVQRLSLVASKTDNAVLIAGKEGLIEWVNESFMNLTGYTFEEVKGKKPGSFLQGTGTDQKQVAEFRQKLMAKKPFYQEIYNYSKNGNGYWVASNITPILDENNEIVQFISIGSDVTRRKEAERALEQSQEDVSSALEMQRIINDSMIVAQKELAKKNEQLGKSEEEMRQIMERQLEANEQLMMAEKKIKNALDSELAGKQELERTYGTLKDAQSQLVHSEKMASLGQLTAGIAHEINNPINFVYNGIDTLKMSLDELLEIVDKYAELDKAEDKEKVLREVQALKRQLSYGDLLGDINSLVGDIKKGAVRTMEIVKGLRVFSRLDEEEKKFANIADCLDATLILLNNKFKGKVEIRKLYDDSMKEINCYPGQLNQVFMNIINNAIQAIPDTKKDGLITIYTETQEENIVIRIKDNGAGMSEQVKKRVFEPFFTTKAVGVGTGLGMSITFGIIEKHNGQIFVNSEEGKGTEFVIQIPKNLE